jgi:arylsulfatase A-like enzyme
MTSAGGTSAITTVARWVIEPPTSIAFVTKGRLLPTTMANITAGRAAFITGQNPIRTGLTKVGMPGADVGLRAEDPTIAELLKPLGYATGQFDKNHLGDKDEFLPTMHGFDEFFGNLYHLNAEEEPEDPDYPKNPAFKQRFGPRGVLHSWSDGNGRQRIEDTGPLTKKRMETMDEEVTDRALNFIDKAHKNGTPFFLWYNTTRMHFRTHCASKHKGKSGQGDYNDVMVAHDENIGRMLAKLDELGIADDTIVMYSTDNGPTTTAGRMAASRHIVAKRTPIGRADGACRFSSVGPARSRQARCSTTSLRTRTGSLRCWPQRETRTLRRSSWPQHRRQDVQSAYRRLQPAAVSDGDRE